MSTCCNCCVAASERGELDHPLGATCPHPTCDFCHPLDAGQLRLAQLEQLRRSVRAADDYLIGALSQLVDDATWQQALGTARRCADDADSYRAVRS